MKPRKRIFISLGILIVLIGAFFVITENITKYTGFSVSDESENKQTCLENQDIKLYINSADSDNTLKAIGLADYLEYFNIQNCYSNKQICIDNGIENFPTWIIDNKIIAGDITETELLQYTGCSGK